MSALGEAKRKVRKDLQRRYQSDDLNRRQARAIAFRPQSEEGVRAGKLYLSIAQSYQSHE